MNTLQEQYFEFKNLGVFKECPAKMSENILFIIPFFVGKHIICSFTEYSDGILLLCSIYERRQLFKKHPLKTHISNLGEKEMKTFLKNYFRFCKGKVLALSVEGVQLQESPESSSD